MPVHFLTFYKLSMSKEKASNIIQIGISLVESYEKNTEPFLSALVKSYPLKSLLTMVYNRLVIEKKLESIERLPHEEKLAMWTSAKELSNNTLELNECKKLAKCLYVLTNL